MKKILVPVYPPYYPKKILKKICDFLEKEDIEVLYILEIIDKKREDVLSHFSDYALGYREIKNLSKTVHKELEKHCNTQAEKISKKVHKPSEIIVKEGVPEDEILKIAREKKVDMIILRHKDKGLMESLVGRNVTEKILKNTKEKALVLD